MLTLTDETFGVFEPQEDPHAAVKFTLTVIADRRQFDRLEPLLAEPMQISGVLGDPGWHLERRYRAAAGPGAYDDWPEWAEYRVYVDPDEYELAYPEAFYDALTFAGYLWVALAVYGRCHPEDMPLVARLLDLLPKRSAEPVTA